MGEKPNKKERSLSPLKGDYLLDPEYRPAGVAPAIGREITCPEDAIQYLDELKNRVEKGDLVDVAQILQKIVHEMLQAMRMKDDGDPRLQAMRAFTAEAARELAKGMTRDQMLRVLTKHEIGLALEVQVLTAPDAATAPPVGLIEADGYVSGGDDERVDTGEGIGRRDEEEDGGTANSGGPEEATGALEPVHQLPVTGEPSAVRDALADAGLYESLWD